MGHTMHYKRMIITPPLRLAAWRLYCSPTTPFSLSKCTAWYEHIINDRWSPMVIALINWMYFCGYQFKDFVLLDRACIVCEGRKTYLGLIFGVCVCTCLKKFKIQMLAVSVYLSQDVQSASVSLCVYTFLKKFKL